MDPSPKTIELLHYPGQWNLELTGSCYSTDAFISRGRGKREMPKTENTIETKENIYYIISRRVIKSSQLILSKIVGQIKINL